MHPETIIFGVVPAIFLLSLLIAFCKTKGFWRSMGKILWLFPMLLVIGLLVVLGYCEANKAYWDYKVRQWCEKDGGVTAYERVTILLSDYPGLNMTSSGQVIFPSQDFVKPKDPFYIQSTKSVISEDSPSLYKHEIFLVRASDKKKLGRRVSYSRVGGDFPILISHPSSYSCEGDDNNIREFSSIVKVKGE